MPEVILTLVVLLIVVGIVGVLLSQTVRPDELPGTDLTFAFVNGERASNAQPPPSWAEGVLPTAQPS